MGVFRLKRKSFAGTFDAATYRGLMDDRSAEGIAKFNAYKNKYADDVAKYMQSTGLSVITPTPKITPPPSNGGFFKNMSTMKKVGLGAAAVGGTYLLGKAMFGGGNNKQQQ